MKIRISGKAFGVIEGSELYYNPDKYTSDPKKIVGAWEAHNCISRDSTRGKFVKAGKGRSYVIEDIAPEGAEVLEEYFRTMGETFTSGGFDSSDTYDDGYACLEVASRLRTQLEELKK